MLSVNSKATLRSGLKSPKHRNNDFASNHQVAYIKDLSDCDSLRSTSQEPLRTSHRGDERHSLDCLRNPGSHSPIIAAAPDQQHADVKTAKCPRNSAGLPWRSSEHLSQSPARPYSPIPLAASPLLALDLPLTPSSARIEPKREYAFSAEREIVVKKDTDARRMPASAATPNLRHSAEPSAAKEPPIRKVPPLRPFAVSDTAYGRQIISQGNSREQRGDFIQQQSPELMKYSTDKKPNFFPSVRQPFLQPGKNVLSAIASVSSLSTSGPIPSRYSRNLRAPLDVFTSTSLSSATLSNTDSLGSLGVKTDFRENPAMGRYDGMIRSRPFFDGHLSFDEWASTSKEFFQDSHESSEPTTLFTFNYHRPGIRQTADQQVCAGPRIFGGSHPPKASRYSKGIKKNFEGCVAIPQQPQTSNSCFRADLRQKHQSEDPESKIRSASAAPYARRLSGNSATLQRTRLSNSNAFGNLDGTISPTYYSVRGHSSNDLINGSILAAVKQDQKHNPTPYMLSPRTGSTTQKTSIVRTPEIPSERRYQLNRDSSILLSRNNGPNVHPWITDVGNSTLTVGPRHQAPLKFPSRNDIHVHQPVVAEEIVDSEFRRLPPPDGTIRLLKLKPQKHLNRRRNDPRGDCERQRIKTGVVQSSDERSTGEEKLAFNRTNGGHQKKHRPATPHWRNVIMLRPDRGKEKLIVANFSRRSYGENEHAALFQRQVEYRNMADTRSQSVTHRMKKHTHDEKPSPSIHRIHPNARNEGTTDCETANRSADGLPPPCACNHQRIKTARRKSETARQQITTSGGLDCNVNHRGDQKICNKSPQPRHVCRCHDTELSSIHSERELSGNTRTLVLTENRDKKQFIPPASRSPGESELNKSHFRWPGANKSKPHLSSKQLAKCRACFIDVILEELYTALIGVQVVFLVTKICFRDTWGCLIAFLCLLAAIYSHVDRRPASFCLAAAIGAVHVGVVLVSCTSTDLIPQARLPVRKVGLMFSPVGSFFVCFSLWLSLREALTRYSAYRPFILRHIFLMGTGHACLQGNVCRAKIANNGTDHGVPSIIGLGERSADLYETDDRARTLKACRDTILPLKEIPRNNTLVLQGLDAV